MKRKITNSILASVLAITTCSTSLFAQNVNIPDVNFKNALLNHTPIIDIDGNNEISVVEAQTFSGILNVDDNNISDLTGIEEFSNIIELDCGYNTLSSLDLSNNISLTSIKVLGNQLTSLNINGITALNLLWCQDNQLTSLNLSSHSSLTDLSCFDNQLTSLNVANGNQDFDRFWVHNNPSLTCIQVENAAYSTLNWLNGTTEADAYWYDEGVDFSEDCAALASIESIETNSLSVYPNPASTIVTISELVADQSLKVIDITGKVVFQTIVNSSTIDFDITTIENGIYIIQVEQNGAVAQKKLVVNK
jgi:hypothetical protein